MVFLPASPTRLFNSSHRKKLVPNKTSKPEAPPDNVQNDVVARRSSKRRSALASSELIAIDRTQDPLASPELPKQTQENARAVQGHSATADSLHQKTMNILHTTENMAAIAPTEVYPLPWINSANVPEPESSAFDQESESEDSVDNDDTAPVMGRASSVRISRPQIVQHALSVSRRSTSSAGRDPPSTQGETSNSRNSTLPTMPEEPLQTLTSNEEILADPREILNDKSPNAARQRATTIASPTSLVDSRHYVRRQSTSTSFDFDEGLRTGDTLRSQNASLSEASEGAVTDATPRSDSANDTTASVVPTKPEILGVDLPRSNSIASPKSGLSRRVTIRPSDLITPSNMQGASSFRESIVTTPYPPRPMDERRSSESDSANSMTFPTEAAPAGTTGHKSASTFPDDDIRTTQVNGQPGRTVNIMPPTPGERDRFPSPSRAETLFLDLGLAAHSTARITLEIEVIDKSTFDDEELFLQIRRAYFRQLLGARRWPFCLFRKVDQVLVSSDSMGLFGDVTRTKPFDAVDFTKHFLHPSSGNRRKTWTAWLRSHNPHTSRRYSESQSMRYVQAQMPSSPNRVLSNGKEIRHISNIKSLRSRPTSELPLLSHSDQPSSNTTQIPDTHRTNSTKAPSRSHSRASSFNFIYSPLIPRLPFLRPSPGHSRTTSAHTTFPVLLQPESDEKSGRTVSIVFHHRYSVLACSLLTLLVILSGLISATIWIIFGTPGSRPGEETYTPVVVPIGSSPGSTSRPVAGNNTIGVSASSTVGPGSFGIEYVKADWRVDARARVLTGAVIGLVIFLIGSAVECGLILGGRVLL